MSLAGRKGSRRGGEGWTADAASMQHLPSHAEIGGLGCLVELPYPELRIVTSYGRCMLVARSEIS